MDHLDYIVENIEVRVGQIVRVPFKSKSKIGLVVEVSDKSNIEDARLKAVSEIINERPFSEDFIKFLFNAAQYYYQTVNSFVKLAIPSDDLFGNYRPKKITGDELKSNHAVLNSEQAEAYGFLQKKFYEDKYNIILLEGVTGSGKTEVYLNLIADHLSNVSTTGQVLILLPEIALTKQLIDKIKQRLSIETAVWHSDTSKSDKKKIYQGIIDGSIKLVVGARSGLFLPYKNLKLIIVDEEHDGSYKQEEQAIYHARDMAVYRAFHERFMVVLVSATPSIETLQNIIDKKYEHIKLSNRYGAQNLAEYKVIDMKLENIAYEKWISNSLKAEIINTITNGKQALLYLNRRGYAPLMICSACGYKLTCPNCATWLVEHKQERKIKCHHCNYSKTNHDICPSCKVSGCMKSCGPGVEKIAEEVRNLFPEEKITIITKDTMSSSDKMEKAFSAILNNEVSIIIGTQMVAKGHHFPNLTLVGIIDADIGFGGADLRATEKTYQLLEQVSGRSGREAPGRVAIQTYNTDSKLLKYIVNNDRESFVQEEISLRKIFKLPPFSRLIYILVTSKKEAITKDFAQKICKVAPRTKSVEIYGPSPSYLVRLKDKYRYHILMKCSKNIDCHKYLDDWLSQVQIPRHISVKVDVDPYNFI